VDSVHDQTDLSQHPAYTVSVLGETASDVRGATGPVKVLVTFLVCSTATSVSALRVMYAYGGAGEAERRSDRLQG
jgi:hypothetical protein